ncbi:HIUase/Transthyretin family protein [Pricia antarctica]|uniref:HIUase/Transthyretin family protein n=1 Tax=Pricia antarctica TaxID=641691 RepID=A0A1G7DCG8_9FLAO|nr:hydroxyisourate hydrolase [Pricia antarctica]SDE49169.1 HIUase/Transthyretin family protein [Pricia antarctica]
MNSKIFFILRILPGIYRLTFYVELDSKKKKLETFYPFVKVAFKIEDDAHYHVPIALSDTPLTVVVNLIEP